jgi:hypothetical protein
MGGGGGAAYGSTWAKRTGKRPKTDFPKPAVPMGRGVICGLVRKWLPAILIDFFLGHVEFGLKLTGRTRREGPSRRENRYRKNKKKALKAPTPGGI